VGFRRGLRGEQRSLSFDLFSAFGAYYDALLLFLRDLALRGADGRPVRDLFPLMASRGVAYLDHAASAQKLVPVLDAWRRFQETSYANVHRGAFRLSEEATGAYEAARRRVAAFLGVSAEGLIFVRGATEGLNLAAHGILSGRAGVPVDLTELDRHANLVPWHF
jgi:cysteine desulfurase/selenocysteine lyase